MKSARLLLCLGLVGINCGGLRRDPLRPPDDSGAGGGGGGGSGGIPGATGSGGMSGSGGLTGAGGVTGLGGVTGYGGMSGSDGGTAFDAPLDLITGPDVAGCTGTTKKCGAQCVALTDPVYGCGATTCDATSCPNPGAGGIVTCMGTTCVIGTCPSGTKKCGNTCVAVADPTYGCSATTCDASTCPAAGSGTLVCQGTACVVGTCESGTKKCGSKCVPMDANNGCGDTARCTACAAKESCVGSPTTQCQCVPDNTTACLAKACGPATNNCGTAITCPNTCTGVNTCGGGNAGVNGCGCTPNDAAACAGKACGPATNNCGAAITCPNTCTGAKTCGAGSAGANSCGCAGPTKGSDVVIMGESFYAITPQYIQNRIQADARTAGSLGATDTYRNVAISGQNMNYIATTEWNAVSAGGASVKWIIMDGGATDCLGASTCSTCATTFQTLLGKMATAGVQEVIYTRYPEPGNPPGSNATTKACYDSTMPGMQTVCEGSASPKCHWVDLRPVWVNGDTTDGAHPTQSGGDHVGDLIWSEMVKECFAQ